MEKKLNKLAMVMFEELYSDCTAKQQKKVLMKYYQEEDNLGICEHCNTSNDFDVLKCSSCGAPLKNPLRSEIHKGPAKTQIMNVSGNGNICYQDCNNSNVTIVKHINNAVFE